MSAAVTPRHARLSAGLMRSIYLPRTADALAFAMSTYGIPLLVLATTRSAALTGAAFALEWIPRLAAFGWAGSIVDRRGAAVVFHLASLGRALVLAAGAVLLHLHPSGTVASATVMVLAATTGVLTEFSYIAAETAGAAAGRRVGARAHRVQAVLLGIDQTATLAGPALAGVLLLAGPPPMLAVITVLSLLAAVLALRTPRSPAPARALKGQTGAGLLTGWRTIRTLPALGWLVTGLTLSNLATGLLQAAGPVIVVKHFGQSTTAVGLIWSAAAAATLLAVTICRFALDRLGLWPVGATCAALASLACLAAAQAPDYLSYLVLVAVLMAADGGMTVVLRTLRSRLIPPEQFGSTLSATILILLLPFPIAGVLTALTPPAALGHAITACAALQALGLFCAFARLRTDPALRT
ncbi:putative major facilitator transporter [Streptomyces scabiei 87.22]|uniref:Putative major facilitator transporter n=1 Tax=Streptomyces scabiei (strain 87.22) TaxID=680198 RepID=C9YXG8_STRSW|nr:MULTISPECIES: MFS transporter [Streptomyces]MDX2531863.1 MFS transporter [Streptomyces scabiei]MDX2657037.1 MFS transporter [Streptomyces scabiei]MDX2720778.1 MFS transporter [Streptomyces scabiei]MDX2751514.1 MFS transporter [Streptomyces scabiei]MDX2794169.1 MFS transporter [Streptomyces scabiei]